MELQGLLTEIEDVLQANPGRTTLGEHHIRTNDAKPVKLPPFRLPHTYQEQVRKELDEMLESGIIKESTSEWASPGAYERRS